MAWRRVKDQLDFELTCPVIDGNLSRIEASVWENLPATGDIEGYDDRMVCDTIMEAIRPHIEAVRETNIQMMAAADREIRELIQEIEGLKDDLDGKDREIDRLERRLMDLE